MNKDDIYFVLMIISDVTVNIPPMFSHILQEKPDPIVEGYLPVYRTLKDLRVEHGDDAPFAAIRLRKMQQE